MTVRPVRTGRSGSGLRRALAAAVAILALPEAAAATHADGVPFTFEFGNTEWCRGASCEGGLVTQFATWQGSNRYLGVFGEETIRLPGMDYLKAPALYNNRAYLSFDLILTDDWQGNGHPVYPNTETFFTVVANGTTILNTSFSNRVGIPQAYPGAYPSSSNPAGTGSMVFDTSDPDFLLSVYRIYLPFSLNYPSNPGVSVLDCCAGIDLQFSANFGSVWDQAPFYVGPRWGLDNVIVSSTPIPEPTTGALLGLGLLTLGARRRRA